MSGRRLMIWVAALALQVADASHFRGGILMMRPTDPQFGSKEMEISFQVSWRRDSSEGNNCDQSVVDAASLSPNDGVDCVSGCNNYFSVTSGYYCTDYSVADNWAFGERYITYNFSANDVNIELAFQGVAWMAPFSSSWKLPTSMSLVKRSDIGRINSTPRAITAPVVKLMYGCNHTIVLAVSDPDNDIVHCRWAVGFNECGGVCNAFPGAILHEESCTITYMATQSVGFNVAALMLEDFLPGSSTPLSSVGLQFIVEVYSSAESCNSIPAYTPITFPQGSCVAFPPNSVFTGQIVAYSGKPGATITEFKTVGPSGIKKSLVYATSDPDTYAINVTWSPKPSQLGKSHLLCYTALNSLGLSSQQSCVEIMAGLAPPYVIQSSLTPQTNDRVHPEDVTIHLEFDQPIQPSGIDARMFITEFESDELMYEINLNDPASVFIYNLKHARILQNFTLPEKKRFYIEMDGAAFLGFGCELPNEPITGTEFWTFTTRDITPPLATLINFPGTITGEAVFEWSLNEPAESLCSLDDAEFTDCSGGTYEVSGLAVGTHILIISHIDLEFNVANTTHVFEVEAPSKECRPPCNGMNIKNEIHININ